MSGLTRSRTSSQKLSLCGDRLASSQRLSSCGGRTSQTKFMIVSQHARSDMSELARPRTSSQRLSLCGGRAASSQRLSLCGGRTGQWKFMIVSLWPTYASNHSYTDSPVQRSRLIHSTATKPTSFLCCSILLALLITLRKWQKYALWKWSCLLREVRFPLLGHCTVQQF